MDIYRRFKVAHLDFFEAHHPNFERLILYCLSSVGQAASHIYQRLNELVKKVGLIVIGVTIAAKRWRHDFCISVIFSTSRPKLLKWVIVSYSLGVDLQYCKVWKNSMGAFSKKNRVEYFPVKNYRFTLFSIVSSVPVLSWQIETMFSLYVIAVAYSYFSWRFYPVCFSRFQMK